MSVSTEQMENVQIDYGTIYSNYGETDQAKLGPVRGGGEFGAEAKISAIEFDGANGADKGTQIVESIDASLSVVVLDSGIKSLAVAMPWATYDDTLKTLTCATGNIGIIPSTGYLKNVTMFCKTVKGDFRKITLYNAMNLAKFAFKAEPKKQGEVSLELSAHWDHTDDTQNLFEISTLAAIVDPVV